jgi:hypothetical protein
MKKAVIFCLALVVTLSLSLSAQQTAQPKAQDSKDKMSSENIDREGKEGDLQIKDTNERIQGVIQKYKLMENPDIRILPYQTSYDVQKEYIYIERHYFMRDVIGAKIIGEKRKSVKLYVSGGSLTKIESVIYERDYDAATEQSVEITDPSPATESTDDIIIKQYYKTMQSKRLVLDKKLGDIKNTTSFSIRNDMKRDFYIPHLQYFYTTILNVAESYSKNSKDSDSTVIEFLKRSSSY